MPDFEFLEHTADLKCRANGTTLPDALINMGTGLTQAIIGPFTDIENYENEYEFIYTSLEELTHDFLTEILYEVQYGGFIPKKYELKHRPEENKLNVILKGEKKKLNEYKILQEIKAVTFHSMKVEQKDEEWVIEVICDT